MAFKYRTYNGAHTLDLAPLLGRLVDIEQGGRRGMRQDLEGFGEVVLQLEQRVPVDGAAAGVPQDVYDHFLMCNETVAMIEQQLAIARKQVEVLEESRAFYIDARNNDISLMVDAMRSRAQRRKDSTILLPFAETIQYARQIGDKAARTRRKNAEAAEQEADAEAEAGAEEAEAEAEAAELRAQLEAYKAEMKAQFEAAVQAAVQQRLAGMTAAPATTAAPAATATTAATS